MAAAKEPKDAKTKATKKEVVRTVTRTFLGQHTEEVTTLEIRPFATETATVAVRLSTPVEMGGKSNPWITVEITCPCYKEEIQDVYPQVSEMVAKCIGYELDKLKGEAGGS